ncbi:MAG TPA: glycosyltransferase family A protein, partial [Fibrobacteraceae bacterium]|nr:glycosyltransferase family A protein [Fibrobacteraceae bacterium]
MAQRILPWHYVCTPWRGGVNRKDRPGPDLVVSLTTYPARIGLVHLALESLLRQTLRPDRILLWLAEEQFPQRRLPPQLVRLQQRGLEVLFRKNLGPHTKYLYALQDFTQEIVVTVDDDCFYPPTLLAELDYADRPNQALQVTIDFIRQRYLQSLI